MAHNKKQRPSSQEQPDELSLIKAAAWAWYQHGSGTKSVIRESGLTRTARSPAPRPTRYKLEALQQNTNPPTRLGCGATSLLLDLYEIERITQELNNLIGPDKKESRAVRVEKKVSGFWIRQAAGICGSRNDVAEAAVLRSRRRGKPRAVS